MVKLISLPLLLVAIFGSYFFYTYLLKKKEMDATLHCQAIVQTIDDCEHHCSIATSYFAEVLGLCIDHPTRLVDFDLMDAQNRLLATHIFKEIRLKKMKPNLLCVHYTTRLPIAFLADVTNTAMDAEGSLFPYTPFYSPRHMPEIFVGQHSSSYDWGEKISLEHLLQIQKILNAFGAESIAQIDLSKIDADTIGSRELVITLRNGTLLRLSPKNYVQQLEHFFILRRTLLKEGGATIVDMRIPNIAYLQR